MLLEFVLTNINMDNEDCLDRANSVDITLDSEVGEEKTVSNIIWKIISILLTNSWTENNSFDEISIIDGWLWK